MKGAENGLSISASIVVLLLQYSRQIVIPVDNCPSNERSWENKSRSFPCDNPLEVYHCIQNSEHALIETCFQSYYIPFFKVGCPWVKIYNEKPILGNPFNPCPSEHTGCPVTFHDGYKTNELYKYPACIQSDNIIISYGSKTVTQKSTTAASRTESIERNSKTLFIAAVISGCLAVPY